MLYKKLNLTLLGVMSTTFVPNITYADLYTCKSCTNAPKGAYYTSSGTNATNCAWECSAGFIKKNNTCMCSGRVLADGNCRKYEELTTADFTKFQTETTAGKCKTGTLSAGAYMVRLRGGNGGSGGGNNTYDPKTQDGFSFNYKFYLKDNATYELCLGGNGSNGELYTHKYWIVGKNSHISEYEMKSIGFNGTAGGTSSLKITMNKKDYFIFANGGWGTKGICRTEEGKEVYGNIIYKISSGWGERDYEQKMACITSSSTCWVDGDDIVCKYAEGLIQEGSTRTNTIGKGTKASYLRTINNNNIHFVSNAHYNIKFYTGDDGYSYVDKTIPAAKMTAYPDASYSSNTCKEKLGILKYSQTGGIYASSECYDTIVGFGETEVHDARQPFNTNISGMETCTTACAELYKIVD